MAHVDPQQVRLLIIGGTSRSATTAVFGMLRGLPGFRVGPEKECRYFLPKEVPLLARVRLPDPVEEYLSLFGEGASTDYLLDATPDYLHYPGSEQAISGLFPHARCIFILRDPVDRMVSWFRYARQRGMIDGDVTFRRFLDLQEEPDSAPHAATHLLARAHGIYAPRLNSFSSLFDRDQLGVFYFEHLRAEAEETFLPALQSFLSLKERLVLDPTHMTNASRGIRSSSVARTYDRCVRYLRRRFPDGGPVRALGRLGKQAVDSTYSTLNGSDEFPSVDEATLEELREYYAPSVKELCNLPGVTPPPWPCWTGSSS